MNNRTTPEGERTYQNQYNLRIRVRALQHYGGKCFCCGEDRSEFLALDHENGDGKEQRKVHGQGRNFYMWLKRKGFPSGFRVACHNCNLAMGFYGYCPHQQAGIQVATLSPVRPHQGCKEVDTCSPVSLSPVSAGQRRSAPPSGS